MRLLLFFIFAVALQAEVTLKYLQSKPSGIERDFYIWEFLKQPGITPSEVEAAYKLARYKNYGYLYKQYMKVTKSKGAKAKDICKGTKGEALLKKDPWCIDVGLTYPRMIHLSPSLQKSLAKKLAKQDKDKAQLLTFLSKHSLKDLAKTYPARYADIFVGSSEKTRQGMLDLKLDKKTVDTFPHNRDFLNMVKIVVQNNYPNLQRSFLNAKAVHGEDSDIVFYFGINALNHGDTKKAAEYFKSAIKVADGSAEKNKPLFWLYLLNNDKTYLSNICQNNYFDFYALNAYELLDKKQKCFTIEKEFHPTKPNADNPIDDPFFWAKMKQDAKKDNLSVGDVESLFTPETLPHYSFLKRVIDGYKSAHFIMPYRDALEVYEPERQALLYAIGKQESLFMPSAVSHSFALGMMQIMPFNVEAIAKQRKEKTELTDMFDYKKNLIYSNHLVKSLVKRFEHPIFVAYAYNGGGGFTNKMLKRGAFKPGKYEPYLSIEMVPITESREYGKKVLANYVIYSDMLGEPTTMQEQISKLKN